jgi:hypothetical protein
LRLVDIKTGDEIEGYLRQGHGEEKSAVTVGRSPIRAGEFGRLARASNFLPILTRSFSLKQRR